MLGLFFFFEELAHIVSEVLNLVFFSVFLGLALFCPFSISSVVISNFCYAI